MRRAIAGIGVLGLAVGLVLGHSVGANARAPSPSLVPMDVLRVARAPDGDAVVILRSAPERKLLLIAIGDAEAHAIDMRLTGRRAFRPMTHDLLEQVISRIGVRLTKVHVEDLRDNVFYGRVFLRQGDKDLDIDARPSDSIALAVGAKAPVLVSRKVLDRAGIPEPPSGGGSPDRDKDISL